MQGIIVSLVTLLEGHDPKTEELIFCCLFSYDQTDDIIDLVYFQTIISTMLQAGQSLMFLLVGTVGSGVANFGNNTLGWHLETT